MKNGKLMLLMGSIVAIGIFALPGTLSLGKGQHTFVNGTDVNCNKCHAADGSSGVGGELNASDRSMYNQTLLNSTQVPSGTIIHKIGVGGAGGIQSCETCHTQTSAGLVVNDTTGNSSHTGVLMKPICIGCHNGIDNELNNTAETHKAFYTAAVASTDENIACMGCHTGVQVTGSPTYTYNTTTVTVLNLTIGGVAGP